MSKEIEIKNLKFDEVIPYEYITSDYGRAEFVVCPVFKRSILKEFYIFPRQQPKYFGKAFKLDLENYRAKNIYYQTYPFVKGNINVWYTFWCKEHKCHSLEFYVVNDTSKLKITRHFGDSISLEFR